MFRVKEILLFPPLLSISCFSMLDQRCNREHICFIPGWSEWAHYDVINDCDISQHWFLSLILNALETHRFLRCLVHLIKASNCIRIVKLVKVTCWIIIRKPDKNPHNQTETTLYRICKSNKNVLHIIARQMQPRFLSLDSIIPSAEFHRIERVDKSR